MLKHLRRLFKRSTILPSLNKTTNFFSSLADVQAHEQQLRLMQEDQCILVDENDNVTGQTSKDQCHTWSKIEEGGMLHRAFSAFVFNDKDELLLQKRSKHKITFPGLWSNTCCSHPLYNLNEYENNEIPECIGVKIACQRKLFHEIGATKKDIPLEKIKFAARVMYKARCQDTQWGEHELDYILFIRSNLSTTVFNTEEVEQVEYVTKDKLAKLIESSDKHKELQGDQYRFSPWFLLLARSFLLKNWWHEIDTIDQITDKTIYKL